MIDHSQVPAATPHRLAQSLSRCGQLISRYGLVVVLAWIGFGKYVKMESRVLIEHSPLMSWIYDVASVTAVARGLGTMEIVAAVLIALRPVWPRASGGWQRPGRGALPRNAELLVHHSRRGRDPRRRPPGAVGAAGPIPAQGSRADRRRAVDARRLACGAKSVPLINSLAEASVAA